MTTNEVNNLYKLIDNNAGAFIGILLTRIEILQDKGLTIQQFHKVFKAAAKELFYENSRTLKSTIKFADDSLKFVNPKP